MTKSQGMSTWYSGTVPTCSLPHLDIGDDDENNLQTPAYLRGKNVGTACQR